MQSEPDEWPSERHASPSAMMRLVYRYPVKLLGALAFYLGLPIMSMHQPFQEKFVPEETLEKKNDHSSLSWFTDSRRKK